MRQMIFVPLLTLALAGLVQGQETTGKGAEEAKAEILKVEDQMSNAVKTGNWDALPDIFADGMSWIARGDRLDKAQVIADYRSGNLHFHHVTHDNVQLRIFGDTAVMTGHSTSVLDYKGKLYTAPRLFTSVYAKINGRWQLVAHHVSDLTKEQVESSVR
jgi:hypothetical protein